MPDNGANRVTIFALDRQSGVLLEASEPIVPVGNGPTQMAIDPTSRFAYVVNRADDSISQFTIDSGDGNLVPMPAPVVPNPGHPWQIVIDPFGQLAYVSNEDLDKVTIYSIAAEGALTPYGSAQTGSPSRRHGDCRQTLTPLQANGKAIARN